MRQRKKEERQRKWKGLFLKILSTNLIFFVLPSILAFLFALFMIEKEGKEKISEAHMTILMQADVALQLYLEDAGEYIREVERQLGEKRLLSRNTLSKEDASVKEQITAIIEAAGKRGRRESVKLSIICEGNTYGLKTGKEDESAILNPNLTKLKEEYWFSKVMETSGLHYIATLESGEYFTVSKESAMHVVSGLKDEKTGEFFGIIDVSIPREKLEEILMPAGSGEKRVIGWIDSKGNIVSSTGPVGENKEGFLHTVTNSATGWQLVMYERNLEKSWINVGTLLWSILVGGICVLLLFIVSSKTAGDLKEGIKELKEKMRDMSEGEYSVRTVIKREDELGELGMQFNSMAEGIEESIGEIRKKEEKSRILELQLMRAQFNPDFLYQSLYSIYQLVEKGMKQRAGESLSALIGLMKSRIADSRELVSIEEELHILENYLILTNNQYEDRFDWTIHMEDEILRYSIPRITLQPLVENSISHGFQNLSEREKKGHVWILGHKEGEQVIITIKDNGTVADLLKIKRILDNSEEEKDRQQEGSIGIRQIQERIHLIFGKEYGIRMGQSEYGGLSINVVLPGEDRWSEQG